MRRLVVVAVAAVALALPGAASAIGNGDDHNEPVADVMASQDPQAFDRFTSRPCKTRRSVNCYWEAIGHTKHWGRSYFAIRIGGRVCVRYWDTSYNRKHGDCYRLRSYRGPRA